MNNMQNIGNIEKEFLKLEILKKLRDIGFYYECIAWWSVPIYGEEKEIKICFEFSTNTPSEITYIPAPLIQQVFRWFREKHDYVCYVENFEDGTFDYTIIRGDIAEGTDYGDGPFQTYEEAEEACILRVIELLK